jgi:hypothetical protein
MIIQNSSTRSRVEKRDWIRLAQTVVGAKLNALKILLAKFVPTYKLRMPWGS